MNLIIGDKVLADAESNNFLEIPAGYLQFPSVHMFIASHDWENIIINNILDSPANTLKHLHLVCKNVKVKTPDNFDQNVVDRLIELLPDLGGKIRKCYLFQGNLTELLHDILV